VLAAAAVCPHPPLLIPAAMGAAGSADGGPGGGTELRELRASAVAAVAALLAAEPDLLVMVGGAAASASYAGPVAGSLRPFGIPWPVGSAGWLAGSAEPALPLSLTVGGWLLEQARHTASDSVAPGGVAPGRLQLRAVAADMTPADCLRLGADLASMAPRVAVLAMGDASARKAAGLPGAADPAAERYDAAVSAALATADPAALASLDPALDGELMIAGRAAWQVLAGAASGVTMRGQLRRAMAPYDVTYLVASWESTVVAPA
jgi:hypothetical protein